MVGKLVPDPVYKKSEANICLDQQSEVFYSLFLLYFQVEIDKNIFILGCWPLALASYKAF